MWRRRPKTGPNCNLQTDTPAGVGESGTPGLGRQTESELSDIYVNDGFWDEGVCIDYRFCLMGHNSLQGCQGSVRPLNCELRTPHKSTHDI